MTPSRVRLVTALSVIASASAVFLIAGWLIDRRLQAVLDQRLGDALLAQVRTVANGLVLMEEPDSISLALVFNTLSKTRDKSSAEMVVLLDSRGKIIYADPPQLGVRPYLTLDNTALASALTGKAAFGERFRSGGTDLKTAFAPVYDPFGNIVGVVGVEAPADFFGALRDVREALVVTLLLSLALVIILTAVVWRFWARSEISERALWHAQQLAAIGRMTATMAHEIRNPLGIIKATGERIRRKYGDGTELFDFIPDEVDRLDRLTEWYLNFAKPADLQMSRVSVMRILHQSVARIRGDLESSGITIDLNGIADLECTGDADRLTQATLNILLNAQQAVAAGGTISIIVRQIDISVRVEIHDDGPGIPERQRDKVFQPFYTTKNSGSGLGLSVVKQIIEAHGGRVGILGRAGEGTTVWYEVPRATRA
jgi:signal transduction histidine kinase